MLSRRVLWLLLVVSSGAVAQELSAPRPRSPGSSKAPGRELDELTPRFTWRSIDGADRYGLYVSREPYGPANLIYENERITETEFRIPAGRLATGGQYRWNIRAFVHSKAGAFSKHLYFHVSATIEAPRLSKPGSTKERGKEIDELTPRFHWRAVDGADRYGLYVSKSPYGARNVVYENERVSGTSRELRIPSGKLQPGGKYRWNMRAFRGRQASPFSAHRYFTVEGAASASGSTADSRAELDAPRLRDPRSSRADRPDMIDELTPRFRWRAVKDADRYGLYVSEAPFGPRNLVYENERIAGDAAEHGIPAGRLRPGGTYRWNMRAFRGTTASEFSRHEYFEISATIEAPRLSKPGSKRQRGKEIDDLTPVFRWRSVRGADRYGLYVSEFPYKAANLVYESEDIKAPDTRFGIPAGKLKKGRRYRWNMRAFRGSQAGPFSKEHRYFHTGARSAVEPDDTAALPTPRSEAPGSYLRPKEIADLLPEFTWQRRKRVDHFEIQVLDAHNKLVYRNDKVPGALTSVQPPLLHVLAAGRAYSWKLRSLRGAQASTWSRLRHFSISKDAVITRTLDLRHEKNESGEYYLDFVARTSWPRVRLQGHAFVQWRKQDVAPMSFGWYPAESGWALGPVDAKLANEAKQRRGRVTHRLTIRVNGREFTRSLKVRNQWAKRLPAEAGGWDLIQRDCVTFTMDVAAAAGLAVPGRSSATAFPHSLMEKLIKINASR